MTIYACNSVMVMVEEDNYTKGCQGKYTIRDSQQLNFQAFSLKELLQILERNFFLKFDHISYNQENGILQYSRLETVDAYEPTATEKELWKNDKKKLYLVDYSFEIEKRETNKISENEFKELNINTEL